MSKRTTGFSRIYFDNRFSVHFKYFSNPKNSTIVTKCYLTVRCLTAFDDEDLTYIEVEGISKQHKEDAYNKEYGESLALSKAIDKLQRIIMKKMDEIYKKYDKFFEIIPEMLYNRLEKNQK